MFKFRDRAGVGGFTESLLAIMVVTAAVVLFTITISLDLTHWDERDRATGMEAACEELSASLQDNCSCSDGKALRANSLVVFLSAPPPPPDLAIGYTITVRDMRTGEAMASAVAGSEPLPRSPIATIAWPVAIELVDGSLVPGQLEVSCW